ncbi:hypothetical protein [Paenibacillus thiaminolyticus]|uniref:hypothetical protein n=1 Tax=Paenibacillus thiaminolyticus TaxID=49283 RepID=UPI002175AD37|nr:hypothetical protein [Paenibacillus thiaminolyticus]
MSAGAPSSICDPRARGRWSRIGRTLWNEKYLWLMALPVLLFFVIYKYLPMLGVVIAFKDYNMMLGIWDSKWVGLKHFYRIFENPDIGRIFLNTLIISLYQIVFAFTIPIFLAIMIHEVTQRVFKRMLQTVFYMPHFLSWVVVAGIFYLMFQSDGAVNNMLVDMGMSKIDILSNPDNFRSMLVMQVIWKESNGNFSFSTAVGLMKGLIGLILIYRGQQAGEADRGARRILAWVASIVVSAYIMECPS